MKSEKILFRQDAARGGFAVRFAKGENENHNAPKEVQISLSVPPGKICIIFLALTSKE